ncbi:hypothetical protein [Pigmentiphaga litoralis]|uniref:DUF2946 domain-containing protein n=1 Tax=Pigmentiphaga litoralis TaxID=516702 RepID=A0A7Y9IW68_9BURK|nr:hypothetical protein [Pigmentiphaga litoralis]NYE22178.1 hypothetical protein [Pigmentiphaga litoralis]NYE84207.1 hypothetical protein [Pigmentiphaga litoralis]
MPFFRQFIAYVMIAVFFNTAIGVPLHAAEHLKSGNGAGQGLARAGSLDGGSGSGGSGLNGSGSGGGLNGSSPNRPSNLGGLFDQAQESSLASGRSAPDTRPDPHTAAESCAVCAAHHLHATAYVIWPAAPPAAPASLCDLPSYVSPEIAAAGHRPFAARDPPRA